MRSDAVLRAIDTNIVVRALVGDHAAQSKRARDLIQHTKVFVPLTVILETEWVLRSTYRFERAEVQDALVGLLGLPTVIVQEEAVVLAALDGMALGLDFADTLHLSQSSDCDDFVTFDKALAAKAANLRAPRVSILSEN